MNTVAQKLVLPKDTPWHFHPVSFPLPLVPGILFLLPHSSANLNIFIDLYIPKKHLMTATPGRHLLYACFFLLLTFSGVAVHSQSKQIKDELERADYNFRSQYFENARDIYLKHESQLSPKERHQLAVSTMALGSKDSKLYADANKRLQKLAAEGYTPSMTILSYVYGNGLGVAKDTAQEMSWLRKAASLGDEEALVIMGLRHESGVGVPLDIDKAKEFYYKAESKGNKIAAYRLGSLALEGRNTASALTYLKSSANARYTPAMLKLGVLYEEGTGLGHKDIDEALRWYHKAAKASDAPKESREARTRISNIGSTEPPTNINTVKPELLKLVNGTGNEFRGLLSEEKTPIEYNMDDVLEKATYHTTIVDLGFKYALARKAEGSGKSYGDLKMRSGTFYSYAATIVFGVDSKNAERVYGTWKSLLKNTLSGWKTTEDKSGLGRTLQLTGLANSGKQVVVTLTWCCEGSYDSRVFIEMRNK